MTMTNTYKVLGQLNPAATTATTLYTVPAATSTVLSTLVICNQAGAPATFRVAVRPAGATLAALHYLAYDTVLNQNDMIALTLGITLAATDVVTVYASAATVSFSVFGCEIS
jgi:hypothetical protein